MVFKYSEPITPGAWPNRRLYFLVGYHEDTKKWEILTALMYHPDSKAFKMKIKYRKDTGWTRLQVMKLPKMGGVAYEKDDNITGQDRGHNTIDYEHSSVFDTNI